MAKWGSHRPEAGGDELLSDTSRVLKERFSLAHATPQIERDDLRCCLELHP
jgi:hypothetical protein